jgi:hypothetical protein
MKIFAVHIGGYCVEALGDGSPVSIELGHNTGDLGNQQTIEGTPQNL